MSATQPELVICLSDILTDLAISQQDEQVQLKLNSSIFLLARLAQTLTTQSPRVSIQA